MSSINLNVKSGRVGKDPETKTLGEGKQVSTFTLAISEFQKGENKTMWFNIVAWGQQSEYLSKHVKKGDFVIVNGRDSIRDYEDKQGNKRQVYEIIAQSIEKVSTSPSAQSTPQSATQAQNTTAPDDSSELPF